MGLSARDRWFYFRSKNAVEGVEAFSRRRVCVSEGVSYPIRKGPLGAPGSPLAYVHAMSGGILVSVRSFARPTIFPR